MASFDAPEAPRSVAGSGILGLDRIINGGFSRRRLFLIEGSPGSGKTTLALQFLIEGARHGEPVLYVRLSDMRLVAGSPLRYRRQILALKQFFAGCDCTVVLLDDMTASDHDLQVHSIAHGVVLLEQLKPGYGAERRRLSVLKYRGIKFFGGYHDCTIRTVTASALAFENRSRPAWCRSSRSIRPNCLRASSFRAFRKTWKAAPVSSSSTV
jgi:KaiC/GvpD/RAD55 family RecA-like ATPase